MFTTYTKRHSIDNYGGISWSYGCGYEEVVQNGIPTFYAVDIGTSRVVKFDLKWNYQTYYNLTLPGAYTLKDVNGYFYFSANGYFYKTDTSFNVIHYESNPGACYRQFAYDSSNDLFYVGSCALSKLTLYSANPSFVRSISLTSPPYAVNIYNGRVYFTLLGTYQIGNFPLSDPTNIIYQTGVCLNTVSLFIDSSMGYLVASCDNTFRVDLIDTSGAYLQSSSNPFIVAFDKYQRLIIHTRTSIDIYY
jgi:hypothetical protein